MKKLIASLGLILVLGAAAWGAIDYPSNPAMSPVDIDPGISGWQGYLYVPNTTTNTVKPVLIDYSTAAGIFTEKAAFNVGGRPRGIAISPADGQIVYVATNTTVKSFGIEGATGSTLSSTSFNSLKGIALSPDGTRLYAADPSANKVHVIRVDGGGLTYDSSLYNVSDGVTGPFSVTVSPDNGLLIVVKRADISGTQHTGAVYFYRINQTRALDGTPSYSYSYLLDKTISGLNFPTYAVISGDPQRIYVRTHEDGNLTYPYPNADVLVFDSTNLNYLANMQVNLDAGRGRDHEPVGISINGKYLYLTHLKADGLTARVYRISTTDTSGRPRGDANWGYNTYYGDAEISTSVSQYYDGIAFTPNGGRIWLTRSDDGTYFYNRLTGFTAPSGNLDNPLPGAPAFVHPVTANDGEINMHNYKGDAEWNAPADEPIANLHYDIDYKRVGTETWNQLGGLSMPGYTNYFDFRINTEAPLYGMPSDGNYYQLRVRAYDSTWADPTRSGPFAVSEIFRKAKPTINAITDTFGTVLTKSYYDSTILISGEGFWYRPTSDEREAPEFHVSFFQSGVEKIIPGVDAPDKGVEVWQNNSIQVSIPRSFIDTYLQPGSYDVKVKAFNIFSNSKPLAIGPKLYSCVPDRGAVGDRLKVSGKGILPNSRVFLFYGSGGTGTYTEMATVEGSYLAPGVDGSSSIDFTLSASALLHTSWKLMVRSNSQYNNENDLTLDIITTPTPQITGFEVDLDHSSTVDVWQPTTEAFVYDHIKIVGTDFGIDPGDGHRDEIKNVTIADQVIRDDIPSIDRGGLQVYSWSDTEIRIGIPRRVGSVFLDAGSSEVKVTTAGGFATRNLNLKPRVYSTVPDSGVAGTTVTVMVNGTALERTPRDITIGGVSGGSGVTTIPRQMGDDPDGTGSNDQVEISLRLGMITGEVPVVATVNGQRSNEDVMFNVLPYPQINQIQVRHAGETTWSDHDWAYVYDSIKIIGTGFGADPGDGSRDLPLNNVQIDDRTIRDDPDIPGGDNGLQVYSWSNTTIEAGIPRRVSSSFINAGSNRPVVVTAGGIVSNTMNLNIRPRIWVGGVSPDRGVPGDIVTISGTALEGVRDIAFGATSAGAGTIVRENGVDPDGTNGNDVVTLAVPSLARGISYPVVAIVNSQRSNEDVMFNVLPGNTPNPLVVIPNAAPNTAAIDVRIMGSAFESGAGLAVQLVNDLNPADTIAGTAVTFVSAGEIRCTLPITGRTVGKWDVVVTNPGGAFGTIDKGFTITNSSDPIAQIIDDFEGEAVTYPGDYSLDGSINLTMSTDRYEGDRAGQVTYDPTPAGYRGYYATLNTEQNLADFNTISVRVKVNSASTGKLKLQFTAKSADGLTIKDFAIPAARYINLTDTSYTKYTFLMSDLIEVDRSGNPVAGGASFNDYKSRVTGYLAGFTGNDGSAAPIKLDLVAAEGYTPPTSEGGSISFILYHLETGNENWISTPFVIRPEMDRTRELGEAIADTFSADPGDNITVQKWDNSAQTFTSTSGDRTDTGWIWDPTDGYPITAGEMFKVYIRKEGVVLPFSTTLNLSGDIPSPPVQFTLYHLETGNENRMSIPYSRSDINTTKLLGDAIRNTFTAGLGDTITVKKWDNSTQTLSPTSFDYIDTGWIWDPTDGYPASAGNPYLINIRREAGAPFNTTTRF